MIEHTFDIIIPTVGRDVPFLPKVVRYLRKNIVGAKNIYILTVPKYESQIRKLNDFDCYFVDENKLVEGVQFKRVKKLLEKYHYQSKTGWYLQQFLKLGFALSKYAGDYYLSWDSDTLPLHSISFFDGEHPLFTPKREYNPSYFTTTKALFGLDKIVEYSFIAEHMLFKTEIVQKLINEINNSNVEGDDWLEKILNAGDYTMEYAPFSEFETYGTYCMSRYPELYKIRPLCTFRSAGYIRGRRISDRLIADMALDLDIASFEIYHGPMFPYNLTAIYYKSKQRYFKYRKKPIKEVLLVVWKRMFGNNEISNDLIQK